MEKRTIGILAHVDAGKTTLSEALLYTSGNLRKLGRVDNRNAFLDTYEMERERGITIFAKQAILSLKDMEITLLDTPGHMDFGAEAERTLQVLDCAVLVINAADGVQGHTRILWKLLSAYRIPTFVFVNKMDQEGTDQAELLAELKSELSGNCMDFSLRTAPDFYENLAVCTEEMLDEYLEAGEISQSTIRKEIEKRRVFPVCFGSALRLTGIDTLTELLAVYSKSFAYKKDFCARVFKITRDEKGNRLTHMKITGGKLKVRDEVGGEKVSQIRIYSGEKYETVSEAPEGTVCAAAGLAKPLPGDGLGGEKGAVLPLLSPVLTYGLILPPECDTAQLLPKLRQLEEEEPALHISYNESIKQIQVQLMGQVQTEVVKRLVWERFGVPVELSAGRILYKETIADEVEGAGHFEPLRHYAQVHLLLKPTEEGSGLSFASQCGEDTLNKSWQRLILTHLKEKEHKGVLTGSPVTDMQIILVSGRAHQKHTEGGDFRQAVYRAVRQGLMEARSVLLEPFYTFRLELPEKLIGRAMSDIKERGGTFEAPGYAEETAFLTGTVPAATMQDYPACLQAYSRGLGKLSCELKGYFPCHNAARIIEQTAYDADADLENPSGSVFCAHGAGYFVPWYQVKEIMRLESVLPKTAEASGTDAGAESLPGERPGAGVKSDQQALEDARFIDNEEIERIMNRTFYANKKEKEPPRSKPRPEAPVYRDFRPVKHKQKYLLVDGYNVIFAGEELAELARENMDAARGRLTDMLCNFQAVQGGELILVFDAYRMQGQKEARTDYHNIHVVFTKEAETADQYIERFAHENRKDYDITVATSDGLEQIIIRGQGCKLISARELLEEVHKETQKAVEQYREEQPKGRNYLGEISEFLP